MAEPVTVTVDAKGMPLPPVDPNVKIPDSVKASGSHADALHAQAYSQTPPAPPVQTSPPPATQTPPAPTSDPRANWTQDQWAQHARSMEGRFKQSQEQITSLQTHMTEMGDELLRSQTQRVMAPPPPPPPVTPPARQVTPQDVETYGEDFLNVAQRAALDAVAPRLAQLETRNQQLERRLQQQSQGSVQSALDAQVPNWQAINLSPRFINWLRIRNVYDNKLRKTLLDDAYKAADSARVVSFFKGFLAEEEATGSTEFLPTQEPPLPAAPHTPAVSLESLSAPGHARPAQGTTPAPANEPIWITRGQIAQFFANVRKGVYAGREQDYHNDQAIIWECQRSGRVR